MTRDHEPAEEYFSCPHCGAQVRCGASACRECGSDAETGWAEDADSGLADIPTAYGREEEFDYDQFVAREFPSHTNRTAQHSVRAWLFRAVLAVLLISFVLWALLP